MVVCELKTDYSVVRATPIGGSSVHFLTLEEQGEVGRVPLRKDRPISAKSNNFMICGKYCC